MNTLFSREDKIQKKRMEPATALVQEMDGGGEGRVGDEADRQR